MLKRKSSVWLIWVLCISCLAGVSYGAAAAEVIWQIGQADGSCGEFALAGQASQFQEKFPGEVVYTIGKNEPSQFPGIHPNSADVSWGGRETIPFVIAFHLPAAVETGAILSISLADVHERLAPLMEVELDGQAIYSQRLKTGAGKVYMGPTSGTAQKLFVALPQGALPAGDHKLTITLKDGSWVAYDAIALVRYDMAQILPEQIKRPEGRNNWLAAESFQAQEGISVAGDGTVSVLLLQGGSMRSEAMNLPEGYEAEFSVYCDSGNWSLNSVSPDSMRGSIWQVIYESTEEGGKVWMEDTALSRTKSESAAVKKGWLQFQIQDQDGVAVITITDSSGKSSAFSARHVSAPLSRLEWQARSDTQLGLAYVVCRPLQPKPLNIRTAGEKPYKKPMAKYERQKGIVTLGNGRFELVVETKAGLNPCSLRDLKTGRVYADADYVWPGGGFPQLLEEPRIQEDKDGGYSVRFRARLDSLEIEQLFAVSKKDPDTIAETIRIANPGGELLDTSGFACGFAKRMVDEKGMVSGVGGDRFAEIPYRRRPETAQLCDYTLSDILLKQIWHAVDRINWYRKGDIGPQMYSPTWGSEGWAWYNLNETLLVHKYNADAMEWSLLEPVWRPGKAAGDALVLRFGGAGLWKLGDPEGAAQLKPGESFTFGQTRLQMLDGGWKEAFYSYRKDMDSRGHNTHIGYNPPVHWNELYDNPLWWQQPLVDTPEIREKYYKRVDMKVEADKAYEIGCECLYLDPGWDTLFASCIWADDRLGKQTDFYKWIQDEYGFALALHTPLAAWSDPSGYPDDNWCRDKNGNKMGGLCSSNQKWVEEKARRLNELCKNGAYFIMFDGNWFTGECWDPSHGHSLPPTRQDHLDATLRLCQLVHEQYPKVEIELHDPIIGPGVPRYCPTYFLHGKPGSFNVLWGYEQMIYTEEDVLNRRGGALYYVNLAYHIPIYLHIDLRTDNDQALGFWWYASTCRHLGFGGKHKNPKAWQAHKDAMQTYLRLKPFFTQGEFYGLDETIHVHTLPEKNAAVINCFKLDDLTEPVTFQFLLPEVGLSADKAYQVTGADSWKQQGDTMDVQVQVPSRGVKIIEIGAR